MPVEYYDVFASAYAITYSAQTGLTVGADAATDVTMTSTNKIMGAGDTAMSSATGNTLLQYEGTAVVGGQYDGIVLYDPATGTAYLLTNSTLATGSQISVDYASDPTPGGKADYNADSGTPVICFMPGTAIATRDGTVAVETLGIGDLVLTEDGAAHPISWIGRQTVAIRSADPLRVLPIRIRAGALGEGQPRRDLLVSPDHALKVDGVLMQAGALVNGLSILREPHVPPTFTYYHIELAAHALVLAEGVPAETFVDNVDRLGFDNWDDYQARYGDRPPIAEMDLPRAKAARQVPEPTRARLLARAAVLYGASLATAA